MSPTIECRECPGCVCTFTHDESVTVAEMVRFARCVVPGPIKPVWVVRGRKE